MITLNSSSSKRILLTAVVTVALSAVAFLTVRQMVDDGENGQGAGEEEFPAVPEFSSDRLRWEWERLRDPATGLIPDDIRSRERVFTATLPGKSGVTALTKSIGVNQFEWIQRGPWNIGGRTRAVEFDITGEDTILAGGISGSMWRSTDAGASWVRTTDPDQFIGVSSLAQDRRPGKTNVWYYGTGEASSSASGFNFRSLFVGDGMFKSTDNGRTWRHLEATGNGTPQFANYQDIIWRVATDPSNLEQDEVYSAVQGAIMRSVDGGESWTEVIRTNGAFSRSYHTDVMVTSSGVVYATMSADGSRRGIFRSADGVVWSDITPDIFPGSYSRVVMAAAPTDENVLYFIAETPGTGQVGLNFRGDSSWHSFWKYTYVSGDGSDEGGFWEDRSANLPKYGGSFGDFNSQGGYDLLVRVKPDDENVVFIGGTNLYRSTDGFATSDNTAWIGGYRDTELDINKNKVIEEYDYPNQHPDQHYVMFSPTDPDIMLVGSDGGVHKTTNCLADSIDWISLNNGFLSTQFFAVALNRDKPGDEMILGGTQDNGTWRNNGGGPVDPWVKTGTGDGGYCAVGDGGAWLSVSKQSGRLYRVDLDSEGQVTGSTRIDPEGPQISAYRFITPHVLDQTENSILYYPVGASLWRNNDVTSVPLDNERVTPVGWDSLQNTFVPAAVITALTSTTSNPSHRVWYGTSSGQVFRLDDAHQGQPVPVEVTSTTFSPGAYISCIATDPENGDHAIVVFSNYSVVSLFETTDAGETWLNISGNLEENPNGTGAGPSCRWASILHRGGRTVYLVGTSSGLFATTMLDGENTVWYGEGTETIGSSVVEMIDVRQSDGFVAVGTHGNGTYSARIGLLSVEEPVADAGLTFSEVRPNPVSTVAEISWSIPATERGQVPVRLDLVDSRGVVVRRLVEEAARSSSHTARIDAEGLSNGLYFLRLTANGRSQLRRVVVRR